MVKLQKKAGFCFLSLLLILGLLLSGCGSDKKETGETKSGSEETKSDDTIQIAFCLDSLVIERWQCDRDIFVSTATQNGAEVLVQSAGGDADEQVDQLKYCIKKQVDAIVIVAVDSFALKDVVQEAKKAGIYVISYDRLLMNADTDYYISFNNESVGKLMAENLLENLPDGGNIIRINGSEQDNNVAEMTTGFYSVLDQHDGYNIVHESYCSNWEAEQAYDTMQEILDEGTPFDAVVCGNDDLASMVYKALSERGLADQTVLIGQDADLAACQRIVNGWQSMTVYKSVETLARQAAEDVLTLIQTGEIEGNTVKNNGLKDVPATLLGPVAVTKENMDEVIIDSGFHLKDEVYESAD